MYLGEGTLSVREEEPGRDIICQTRLVVELLDSRRPTGTRNGEVRVTGGHITPLSLSWIAHPNDLLNLPSCVVSFLEPGRSHSRDIHRRQQISTTD